MPIFGARTLFCFLVSVLGLPSYGYLDQVQAEATITINNLDGPGEGFNSTAPPDAASTAGGNPGLTLGQQRLLAFQHAADIWAGRVNSPIPIIVDAALNPQSCSPTSGILGSAGPIAVDRDFLNAPVTRTWFSIAHANSLAGSDLDPGSSDIAATFNRDVDDNPNCLTGLTWYYGLDGNPPPNTINFTSTVLHEIAHGLGFLALVNTSSGTKFFGLDDAYMRYLANALTGETFSTMTNAERKGAIKSVDDLVWTGTRVNTNHTLTSGTHATTGDVLVYAPNPIQVGSSVSHFATTLTPNELMEPFDTGVTQIGLTDDLFQDIGWSMSGCGDGVLATEEECDDAGESFTCDVNCTLVSCGDGTLNTLVGEQCDDGNSTSGDGCSNQCLAEFCGDAILQPGLGEDCDAGNETDTCNADCTNAACGDGTWNATAGEECDDGNLVNADGCSSQCLAEFCGDSMIQADLLGEECDDGNSTGGDGCSATCQTEVCYGCAGEPSNCSAAPPRSHCLGPLISNRAVLILLDKPNSKADTFTWKWLTGEKTTLADFGDPRTTTQYDLCIYDETGGSPSLAFGMRVPAGGTCRNKPCWKKTSGSGFRYKDSNRLSDGIDTITLRQGNTGRARISILGRGEHLPFPSSLLPFSQDSTVTVQLSNSEDVCWQAEYSDPAKRNSSKQFQDKGD